MTLDAPTASGRFGDLAMPREVLLSGELINTGSPDRRCFPDLLLDVADARAWWSATLETWASGQGVPVPALAVTERDLPGLRELRLVVETTVDPGREQTRALRGAVELTARTGGAVEAEPIASSAAGWLEAGLLVERLRAELDGTWARLKVCANPDCRVAFYDRSRNRSGVWHSVERCGNKVNLRRLRARRSSSGLVEDGS